ncbi:MAG: flagellar biosynthesis protein FlhA [Deltaproteobacteria bacterium]|nr:flagellar biosynthesis protein FlhA [Deltaproteobacteria bacterium]MBW1918606.1 flagellar biosynthesis protein FlhA [Deltaproteobacteria bacterium]MBW1934046.1 flagellar biosynthesis protein FlhA [Deltaproteobacteria bacterium]MBW1976382.1 flagellar biosynthesis protein FlhA [Deltaproteobacteria bacterium]MBW2043340.1 flagellar biosynthesis protein FlhA [Deltaproteobacteria bacterium]
MEQVLIRQSDHATLSELLTVVGVVTVLVVMIIPLPPALLDFLLALNITLAISILLIAIYTLKPLDFSIFPSLLLITTLYRLSLNIASTRLILLHGDRGALAAGRVIKSFGCFVVEGNYVVGMIVFTILVIVNFVVITKGATRIAEVAARFTLDAMPGKQMSIDADLNAGLIDEKEAKKRRAIIAREAEFHGAMDGAAKFVRGDAIAGIIITIINIIGGLVIGVLQKNMSVIDAAQNYTLLTVGDGLVSQIPALTISTAAGIVVSRAASQDNMGREFGKQFAGYPKAILLAAFTVFFFGLIPGLPHFPFIVLSLIIGGSVYTLGKRKEQASIKLAEVQEKQKPQAGPQPVEHLLAVDPLEVEVGYGLIPLVDKEQGGEFLDRVHSIRRQFALELGLIIPPIHIRDNLQLNSSEYRILLRGVPIASAELMLNHFLAIDPGDATRKLDGIGTTEPAFNLPAIWIPEPMKEEAKLAGYTVVDNVTVMATHLTEILRAHASELLGRQEVQDLLDNLSKSHPKPVEELVPNLLSLGVVQKVLQNLLQERVSIRDILTIVETLADYAPLTKDPDLLTEYVRHKLSRSIVTPHLAQDGVLRVITMQHDIEKALLEGVQSTEHGSYLSLDPKLADQIITSIKKEAEKAMAKNIQPILLTSPKVRRYLRKMIEHFIPSLIVLSHSELLSDMRFQSIGEVSLDYAD